ncbi:MAG: kinase/pyrophosphorylase [Acidobacteria bacterium]|nr:kinase/pyrophosphorylase [Acidobacteriota bacterium]
MAGKKKLTIFLVSDGRAETAARVLQAAAVQFEGEEYRVERRRNIRTPEAVHRVVKEAERLGAIIFFTLVGKETRKVMHQAMGRNIEIIDLLGPVITALHSRFKREPGAVPGLLYDLERDHYDRMTAFDYVLTHDDGQRIHELNRADVVLTGVSRSSKSSTCFYLAFQGVRAANVPLVPGMDPPPQLLKLPPNRVVGLRINVQRLVRVREARMPDLGLDVDQDYADQRAVAAEVNYVNRLMDKRKWNTVDVSYLAVEEIARQVLHLRWPMRRR